MQTSQCCALFEFIQNPPIQVFQIIQNQRTAGSGLGFSFWGLGERGRDQNQRITHFHYFKCLNELVLFMKELIKNQQFMDRYLISSKLLRAMVIYWNQSCIFENQGYEP